MREILFRAKEKHRNKWCYGIPITEEHNTYKTGEFVMADAVNYDELDNFEASYYFVPIKKETIGQYTGLNDKNGKRIFEGDIVMKRTYHGKKPMKVVFSFGCFHCGFGGGSSTPSHPYTLDDGQIEVIGNIHDNPELLKEGK